MKKFLFLLSMLFVNASLMAAPIKFMVFGDSLSAGHGLKAEEAFGAQLNQVLQQDGYDIQLVNYSRSGETTAGGVKKLKTVLAQQPDAVAVQLGSNDAFRRVPLEKTTENLKQIIEAFSNEGIPVFLIGMEAPVDMPMEYRDGFRKMYADLALEHELLLYPFFMDGLWQEDGSHAAEDYFLPDQIHPSAKGVAEIVRRIHPAVRQFLQEDVIASPSSEEKVEE